MKRFALKLGVFCASVVALPLLIVFGVPDGTDYTDASIDKHMRLEADFPQKLVFVGGSNLAFGLDSSAVEQAFGIPVVNMGMTAETGIRFMLEEVKPFLHPSDIVVLSFEYDLYFRPAKGFAVDHLAFVKSRPAFFQLLTPEERIGLITAVPIAAQQKLKRLVREASGAQLPENLFYQVAVRKGFEEHGDMVAHLDVPWTLERELPMDLSSQQLHPETIELIVDFAREMRGRHISVIMLSPPVPESFYANHKRSIEDLHQRLQETGCCQGLTPPKRYVLPDESFFDSIYHLGTSEARRNRTERVIEDVADYLPQQSF